MLLVAPLGHAQHSVPLAPTARSSSSQTGAATPRSVALASPSADRPLSTAPEWAALANRTADPTESGLSRRHRVGGLYLTFGAIGLTGGTVCGIVVYKFFRIGSRSNSFFSERPRLHVYHPGNWVRCPGDLHDDSGRSHSPGKSRTGNTDPRISTIPSPASSRLLFRHHFPVAPHSGRDGGFLRHLFKQRVVVLHVLVPVERRRHLPERVRRERALLPLQNAAQHVEEVIVVLV